MNLNTVLYIICASTILYLLINPRTEYVPVEYEVVKVDTTEIVRVDTVEIRDTVMVNLEIREPIKEDSINVYRTSFIDSYMTAYINSRVNGELVSQDLTYTRHYDRITIDKVVYLDRYLQPKRPLINNNYTSLGIGLTTLIRDDLELIPNIYLQDKGVIYRVGYNPITGTIEAGINIQIFSK